MEERREFEMRNWTDRVVDMVFRGVLGLVVIYILEQICLYQEFPVLAGINMGSFLAVALLGMPGFLLVYAVALIHFF